MTTNFVGPAHQRPRRRSRKRLITILGIVLVFLIFNVLAFRAPAFALYRHALQGKQAFTSAKDELALRNFAGAKRSLTTGIDEFTAAQDAARKLWLPKIIPGVGRQIRAAENLLRVGTETGVALQTLTAVAERMTEPLQKKDATYASISSQEKEQVLSLAAQTEPDIQGAKAQIDLALTYLEKIPDWGLIGPLASAVRPLREQLPELQRGLETAVPVVRVLPGLLGYPEKSTYLFLLQNNTELRPTGGFIGTYGIVEFHDGEITSFSTHNVYDLDVPAEAFLNETPPEPLQKYLAARRWFFRDSNWSPDFPTSAKEALRFYRLESRSDQPLNGVIAVTPTFISSLMELTGDITVQGITFTPENLVETLQYQVEQGFLRQGLSDADRKEIIGAMTQVLFSRLLTLPQDRWPDLWKVLEENVGEKHVLLYLGDGEEEELIRRWGWAGEMRSVAGDFLMVVDANLASLKSDPGVTRTLSYAVVQGDGGLVVTLRVRYNNQGTFNWKSTRYRTYTRIYVPRGSELLSSSGYVTDDRLHNGKPTTATAGEELGKTVFAGFTSVEPQTENTLELRYRLPAELAAPYRDGSYTLFVQKQPGTAAYGLALDIEAAGRIQSHSPEAVGTIRDNHLIVETDLARDREFQVTFRP